MKKTLTLFASAFLLLASAAAVVGHNNSEGDMQIMGASGSSATTATSPNGTQYYVEISNAGNANTTNESVKRTDRTESTVNFTGVIQSPTPCHTITHDAEKQDGEMVIDISLESSDQMCTQQIVMKKYNGYAKADGLEEVTINHRGKQMQVFETTEPESEEKTSENETPLDVLVRFLQGLF